MTGCAASVSSRKSWLTPRLEASQYIDFKGINGALDRIRTCGLCLRRAALYPAELRVHPVPRSWGLKNRQSANCFRGASVRIFPRISASAIFGLKSCFLNSFFVFRHPRISLTSAFGGQYSIQLSYGCVEGQLAACAVACQRFYKNCTTSRSLPDFPPGGAHHQGRIAMPGLTEFSICSLLPG